MSGALKSLILLYPKAWRNCYQNEFEALLDDVPPSWRTLFDVLGGALKMQTNLWKIAAGSLVVAALAGGVFFRAMPSRYESEVVIQPSDDSQFNKRVEMIFSRATLSNVIMREHLYENDLARVSVPDLAARMRNNDILMSPEGKAWRIRVTEPDGGQAQRAAQHIANSIVDWNAATLIGPASFPSHPYQTPIRNAVLIGLAAGVLFALLLGFRAWNWRPHWELRARLYARRWGGLCRTFSRGP